MSPAADVIREHHFQFSLFRYSHYEEAYMDILLTEYTTLREEMLNKIEIHNNLLTFTITTTIAALTFALSQDSTLLYLVPFFILVPMSKRIAYYRSSMVKLSAYIIVFIESEIPTLNWETRNLNLLAGRDSSPSLLNHNSWKVKLLQQSYFDCFILSVFSCVLFLIDFFKDKEITSTNAFIALIPICFTVYEFSIAISMSSLSEERETWVKRWEQLKNDSCSPCITTKT